jgi:hypothetical protein
MFVRERESNKLKIKTERRKMKQKVIQIKT